jgi:hypothetical protein
MEAVAAAVEATEAVVEEAEALVVEMDPVGTCATVRPCRPNIGSWSRWAIYNKFNVCIEHDINFELFLEPQHSLQLAGA